jgi:predicted phosphodiesterase
MKIQIASDLHLEFHKAQPAGYHGIEAAPDADVLVIAGDIALGANAVAVFKDWPVPVLYVAGNHEYYGSDIPKVNDALRAQCAGTQIHFMERDKVIVKGVRFLGATLWTDYLLFGRDLQDKAMIEAQECLNDHSSIRVNGNIFEPKDALYRFIRSKEWLIEQLATPFNGPTVIITHHGPHWESIHPKYRTGTSLMASAFVSDMTALMGAASLWIHGHVHDSFDYVIDGTRIVTNPRGYPDRRTGAFENHRFDKGLVVDVT